MIKKEKPMLSVAALIEAQNRWVHQRIYHHETFAGLHIKINFNENIIEKKYLKKTLFAYPADSCKFIFK